jgi:septal ring factor EnvC (AmiA/AmiB activator)
MRVLNKHTAGVDGIPAGAEGDVDPHSGGVQYLLAQGLLVPVDGESMELHVKVSDDEIAHMRGRLSTLEGEAFEREEWMAKLDEEIKVRDSRIQELQAQLAAHAAELEKLTAPTAPEEKPVEAAPKGKK